MHGLIAKVGECHLGHDGRSCPCLEDAGRDEAVVDDGNNNEEGREASAAMDEGMGAGRGPATTLGAVLGGDADKVSFAAAGFDGGAR